MYLEMYHIQINAPNISLKRIHFSDSHRKKRIKEKKMYGRKGKVN